MREPGQSDSAVVGDDPQHSQEDLCCHRLCSSSCVPSGPSGVDWPHSVYGAGKHSVYYAGKKKVKKLQLGKTRHCCLQDLGWNWLWWFKMSMAAAGCL